nr:DUF1398 family protein [Desemzia incerta]
MDKTAICELTGEVGVPFWASDLVSKQVTYYDNNEHALLVEPIPGS